MKQFFVGKVRESGFFKGR